MLSRGVSPRSVTTRSLLALALVIGLQVAPPTSPPVLADCGDMGTELARAGLARGTTFVGRLRYMTFQPYETSYTFEVSRVYAGQVPATFTIDSGGCDRIRGLQLDERYLVSTADPDHAHTGDTIVWRLHGQKAELVDIGWPLETFPASVRGVDTLDEAARLMAPGARAHRPESAPRGISGPLEVHARSDGVSCFGGRDCVQLIEITAGSEGQGHFGAQLVPATGAGPRELTNGLPAALPFGDYTVTGTAWSTPMSGPLSLSGTPVTCSTPMSISQGDSIEVIGVSFTAHACTIALGHRALPTPDVPGDLHVLRGRTRSIARSPFAARYGIGAWTGQRVIVVDGEHGRTASYDPATDRWRERSVAHLDMDLRQGFWTGEGLIAIGDGFDGSGVRALRYDPRADAWHSLPPFPFLTRYVDAAWADDGLVVVGRSDTDDDGLPVGMAGAARYDPADDHWAELPLPPIPAPSEYMSVDLYGVGDQVVAIAGRNIDRAPLAMSLLDPLTRTWSAARPTPPLSARERGIVVGDRLWFLGVDGHQDGRGGAVWDASTDTWTTVSTTCPMRSGDAVALGSLLLSTISPYAFDTATSTCYRLPGDGPHGAVIAWTGNDLFSWSGSPGEELPGKRVGSLYRPTSR